MSKKKSEVKDFKNRALQIYDGKRPLTRIEAARLTSTLTMEHVKLMSLNRDYESMKKEGITGRCAMHEGAHTGPGVCIAYKYLKYGNNDNGCAGCRAQEIVEQLNYIFKHAFEGKYRAEWRKKKVSQ